ncbi:hypothetical protein ACOMHN_063169 [Nucella lapillus]
MADTEKQEKSSPVQLQTKTEKGQVCRRLSALLVDDSLRKALVRLVHHIQTESGKELSEQAAAECVEQLTQISFQQVPCVRTVQTKINKDMVVSSHTKPLSFVHNKDGDPRQSVVYLNAEACTDMGNDVDVFLLKLVSAIQFVLGVNVDGLLLYGMLKSPAQAEAILDEEGIKQCAFHSDTVDYAPPRPGSFVPLPNYGGLDNDFHEFCEGEFIAFEVYDPYDMVSKDKKDRTPVYMYATVLQEVGHTDTVFAKHYRIDLGPDRGEADVSLTQLYKIRARMTNRKESSSGEAHEKQTVSSKESDDQTPDVNAVLKDLRHTLSKAWQVCKEDEFQCVTKRLLLKWHPDLHHRESAFNQITGAIFQYAELLRQGESLPEEDDSAGDNVDGQVLASAHLPWTRSVAMIQNQGQFYSEKRYMANPQPGEGRRWLRTAHCDLTAARASRGICQQGRNWVCFLCHQSVEKALKGALYFRNADSPCLQSHRLPQLARQIGDEPLQQLADQMESRMGPHIRMRYPDVLAYPNIPADVYSDHDVNLACDLAGHVNSDIPPIHTEIMAPPIQQLLKGVAFATSLFLTCFFGTVVMLMPCLAVAMVRPTVGRRAMDALLWMWFVFAATMYEVILGIKVVIHGQPAPPNQSLLILCNHRTRLDWLFLVSYQLRCGILKQYRISLKKPLKFIPGPGWAMQCAGFLFLQRDWKIDQHWISQALKYFAQMGTQPQFLLFPEGTDFCKAGLAKSHKFAKANSLPQYEYVLHPRTTGFIHFINQMKENKILDSVVDLTVAYPQDIAHSEKDLCRGIAPQEVHFLVHTHPISELPESPEKLESWLREVWREKEERLEKFYQEKSFAVNGESPCVTEEVERRVWRQQQCVMVFWGVFLCGVFYSLVVFSLFKWFCILSAFTFVFIGRSYGGVDHLLYATCK